jgi:hypothetical protein
LVHAAFDELQPIDVVLNGAEWSGEKANHQAETPQAFNVWPWQLHLTPQRVLKAA